MQTLCCCLFALPLNMTYMVVIVSAGTAAVIVVACLLLVFNSST